LKVLSGIFRSPFVVGAQDAILSEDKRNRANRRNFVKLMQLAFLKEYMYADLFNEVASDSFSRILRELPLEEHVTIHFQHRYLQKNFVKL